MDGASEHGFVLVSFGAGVKYLSEDIAHKLAGALGRLPQKVIWRYGPARPALLPAPPCRRPETGAGPQRPSGAPRAFLVWEVQVGMHGDVGVRGWPPHPFSFIVISLCLRSGLEGGPWVGGTWVEHSTGFGSHLGQALKAQLP